MPLKPRSPLPLRRRLPASWSAIGLFAVVLAYVDGFWMVTLQGAVGAIERSRGPFARWLRESTLLVPFFVAAVIVALLVGRRWFAGRRPWVRQMSTVLVVVAATSTVAIAAVAASSAYDYQIQARHLGLLHTFHSATRCVPRGTRRSRCTCGPWSTPYRCCCSPTSFWSSGWSRCGAAARGGPRRRRSFTPTTSAKLRHSSERRPDERLIVLSRWLTSSRR